MSRRDMQSAFVETRASLDPEGKWTAGDVSNFSALFFAGWNAAAIDPNLVHLSVVPFYAVCGNDKQGIRTTQIPAQVTCAVCAHYWAKFIVSYFYEGEITMDEVSRLALGANSQTVTFAKGQTVHVNGIPYELLDNVEAFSASGSLARSAIEAAANTEKGGGDG